MKMSFRGFGFVMFALFAYFLYQGDTMFPTGDGVVNLWLLLISVLAGFILFLYTIVELVFAVAFSMRRKKTATWNDMKGKLHMDSRYVYFRSNDGEKRVDINCSGIVDVESDYGYFTVYFVADNTVSSESFCVSNPEQTCSDIKKMLGI